MTTTGTLDTRAVLVRLHVKKWGISKRDAKATKDATEANHARDDAGQFTKRLVAKEALENVSKIEGEARRHLAEHSSPWSDDEARIVASARFLPLMDALRGFEAGFDIEADKFCTNYWQQREAARFRLGDMFDEADYPPPNAIRGRFLFKIIVRPVPMADDFRVELDDESRASVKAAMEAATRTQLEEIRSDLRERVRKVAEHMVDRLTKYRPGTRDAKAENTFKDSLVENARALADLLPELNLMNDPEIDALAFRVRELGDVPAQELRENEIARKTTAAAAQAILDSMQGFAAAAE